MLSYTLPVSLYLSTRRFIVNQIGAFLPGNSCRTSRSVWTSLFGREIGLYNLDSRLHGISCSLSIEAEK